MMTTTEPQANGSERAWAGYSRTLETLLRPALPPGVTISVSVSEATDWHEPGTERHGRDYWFLTVRVTPASAWPQVRDRLETLGLGPVYGESEDEAEYGNPAAGLLVVCDVLVGLSQGQVRRRLRRAAERAGSEGVG